MLLFRNVLPLIFSVSSARQEPAECPAAISSFAAPLTEMQPERSESMLSKIVRARSMSPGRMPAGSCLSLSAAVIRIVVAVAAAFGFAFALSLAAAAALAVPAGFAALRSTADDDDEAAPLPAVVPGFDSGDCLKAFWILPAALVSAGKEKKLQRTSAANERRE